MKNNITTDKKIAKTNILYCSPGYADFTQG